MKTLLHAFAVLLTVLLFVLHARGPIAAACFKSLHVGDHVSTPNVTKPPASRCTRASISSPRYKKDPEISLDSERISQDPRD